MLKRLTTVAALSLMASTAYAVPVSLGAAGDFTLLATADTTQVNLGAEAHIVGNVGAAHYIGLGSNAIVDGNVYYGWYLNPGAGSQVSGQSTTKPDSYWADLRDSLGDAAAAADAYSGQSMGKVTGDTIFPASNDSAPSVFNIDGLLLDNGQTLTLSGSLDSQFIINVRGDFQLNESDKDNTGGGIILDGVDPDNVLFNILDGDFAVQHGQLAGTFLYAGGTFDLGDGLDVADGSRFLADGMNANLKDMTGPGWSDGAGSGGDDDPLPVPEPPVFALLALALLGIGGLYGRRMRQLR